MGESDWKEKCGRESGKWNKVRLEREQGKTGKERAERRKKCEER